jgi:cytochrome P450
MSLEDIDLIDPNTFTAGYPHDPWTRLRREAPVYWYERDNVDPFWAITKHADIAEISRQPETFLSEPRLMIAPKREGQEDGPPIPIRTIVNMDPPDHRAYRQVGNSWFTPRTIGRLEEKIRMMARARVEDLSTRARDHAGGQLEFDFVSEFAARFPLRVMAEILGVPEEDEDIVLQLTNEQFGADDAEFNQGRSGGQTQMEAMQKLFVYLNGLAAKRREEPTEDFASFLANAKLEGGEPLGDLELIGYYVIVATAGHETTRNAISGGMAALLEHPEQMARLRDDPTAIKGAIEEVIRWSTPVIQFARTATRDYALRGKTIREGDDVCLFYPSANRDEEVFEEPFHFRIDRKPNPHLGFGIGEHFCLGSHLARLEIRVFLEEFVGKLATVERAGEAERLSSSFVGGVKHLPIRARFAG